MLKKILCFVLMFVMLAAAGVAEQAFEFEGGITWASTPDEVMALLSDGAERTDETADEVGTLTTILEDAAQYEGLDCGRKAFMFYNDELFMISCYFTKAQLGDTQALIDLLTEIYGEPVLYTEADRTDSEWMNGIMTRCSWSLGEDTDIYVIQCQDIEGADSGMGNYPYLCYAGFENPVVYEKMNAAITAAVGQ